MKTLILSALASVLLTASATATEVKTRKVSFDSEGSQLLGTLYLPPTYTNGEKLPLVIVTGAWTSVEEQMPSTYARQMAKRGFAAFTFDFRGWGKSGDLPNNTRFVESPAAKATDIRNAFAHVASLSEVDATKIYGLGICASAGYMVDAAAGNPLVQRVGLVAPWFQNREIVESVYGGADGVDGLISVSRNAAAKGGEIIPAAGPEGAEGVLMPIGGYYYEANRGAIPQYDNKWNNAGWEGWLTYYPADNPQRLDKPLAIIHSDTAAVPQGVRTFLKGFAGETNVRWLNNVTQFDFYDRPDIVETSTESMAAFFKE